MAGELQQPLSLPTALAKWLYAPCENCKTGHSFGRNWRRPSPTCRWPVLRARLHPALFQAFNLTFIALTQNLLLLAITAPAYLAWRCRNTPLNWVDAAATLLNAGFIALEAVADQQQWVFQTAKHKKKAEGKRLTGDYHKGFLTQGLFRYSRHPNFFAGAWRVGGSGSGGGAQGGLQGVAGHQYGSSWGGGI